MIDTTAATSLGREAWDYYRVISEYGFAGLLGVTVATIHKWAPAVISLWSGSARTMRNDTKQDRGKQNLTHEEHVEICNGKMTLIKKDLELVHVELSHVNKSLDDHGTRVGALFDRLDELKTLMVEGKWRAGASPI